ncbi:MAG: dihydrofolate reductase [Desulfuromonadales bacterium]|nr:dihydrofolate reductase [Desulfuromonadales bacterium]MBN2792647.1 dihydrofolate reductase [Desulfuromonadales bacterium]
MLIAMIAAMAENRVIGHHGKLPWSLPTDLERFKQLTWGHTLVMGRHTYESIGRPLPGRHTIILSRDSLFQAPGCVVAPDIPTALTLAQSADQLFVCGGADIYRQILPITERLHLTQIAAEFSGDRVFPEIPQGDFRLIESTWVEDCYAYRYSVFERVISAENFEEKE